MLNIGGLHQGVVIDHIKAGQGMLIYEYLELGKLDCCVAIIKNASSNKMGRKDIIKIDSAPPLNLDVLGFVDPDATINVIRDGKLVEKKHAGLPERIRDVLRCRNPRCITSVEPDLPQVFQLANRETKTYRCIYCEAKAEK